MRKTKILIIDDEKGFTSVVKAFFEETGKYDVHEENRGSRGLLSARQFKPDLILLDINMPDACGGEVAALLQGDPDLKNVPIIFLTALIMKSEEKTIGNSHYVAKPIMMKDLMTRIERELSLLSGSGMNDTHRIELTGITRRVPYSMNYEFL